MKRFPPYPKRPHRTGQARIVVSGQTHYLGKHGSKESWDEYRRLLERWQQGPAPQPSRAGKTVLSVLNAYGKYAKDRYSAKQWDRIRRALHVVSEHYASTPAAAFRLAQLEAVRARMLEIGWSRGYANTMVCCIRKCFKWATPRDLYPAESLATLQALENLRADPRLHVEPEQPPPPWEDVRRILKHLRPPVRAMVLLQWLAGMRTQEVLLMRTKDIDQSGDVWNYRPHQHKNLWRGQERVIHLGPTAQRILRRYLCRTGYLFSPRDALRGRPGGGRVQLRDRYDNMTYARAVARACEKAGVPKFPPYALRHACATRIASSESPEDARLVLGHKSLTATRRYIVDSQERAASAMKKLG